MKARGHCVPTLLGLHFRKLHNSSALDPLSTQTIEALMLRLAEQRTIVLVTHSLAQARRVASRVAPLWHIDGAGRLVEQGPTEEVFTHPQPVLTRSNLQFG